MARVGLDARTGRLLYGWDHCVQSIGKILTTELGSRVLRRGFGSRLPTLIDRPQTEEVIIDFFIATADALQPRIVEGHQYGEPGFILLRSSLDAGTQSRLILLLGGVFFEHGHLGDYSNPSEQEVAYSVTQQIAGVAFEAVR
jgi:hypothetical protein